jgi:DNA-binding transcriptional regulator YhcF (GntR family)
MWTGRVGVARAPLASVVTDANGHAIIRDKISRQTLGSMAGVYREMVNCRMKDLEKRGFIEIRRDGSMMHKARLNSFEQRTAVLSAVS